MSVAATINTSEEVYRAIRAHLIRPDPRVEEAAFAFAVPSENAEVSGYEIVSWMPMEEEDFDYRSDVHFVLADEIRGRVIKQAHDLGASIVEFHSHIGEFSSAKFSYSDRSGFAEIVPHAMWRLKGRPYFAIVMTQTEFDGFAWIDGPDATERIGGLSVEGRLLPPSGRSPLELKDYGYTF